jgi:uncharacterized protein YihD (DUF1040 family)
MKTKILAVVLSCVFILSGAGFCQDCGNDYKTAIQAAKTKEMDLCYLYLDSFLRGCPGSKLRDRVLFASGEYNFSRNNFKQATTNFVELVDDYPDFKGKLFALAYLYKIAESAGQEELMEKLKTEIVTFKRVSLLFRNSQKYVYKSPLLKRHKVVYYIDRVEFYLDGESFAQIPF